MHIIGFSHHYTKLHRQTHGVLVNVAVLNDIQMEDFLRSADSIKYDTEYLGIFGAPSYAPFYRDERLQLTFIGDRQIPFTTYRYLPKNYTPWGYHQPRAYRKSLPYSDLIGQLFAFKFKGEPLPEGLANKISGRPGGCVKIFD